MRIVCAPDSFKESMTALEAARAMADGVRRADPAVETVLVPMADGGEGTTQALADALGGQVLTVRVDDALGRPHPAIYALAGDLAVIEMAEAAGLGQVAPDERDVRRASTTGVGQLIRHALDAGARRFIVGLGGSATNDAGEGMARALGARFLDAAGHDLPPGGAALIDLAAVDLTGLDPRLVQAEFRIACDVDNPLLGPRGASATFGPQKGATPQMVTELDAALACWADVVEPAVGKSVRGVPGAGAAGGLGAAFLALTAGTLRRGVDLVIAAVGLAEAVGGADWVFAGEGSVDAQTLHGKAPWGVAKTAHAAGVPTILFGGRVALEAEALADVGVRAIVPIVRSVTTLGEALRAGPANLAAAAELVTRLLLQ
jgi:glycerate kinase